MKLTLNSPLSHLPLPLTIDTSLISILQLAFFRELFRAKMDPPSNDEDPQRTFAVTGVAGENAVTYMSFTLDGLLSDIVLFSYFTKCLRSYCAENDPPKKKKTMPNRKRKFAPRLRISNCTPVTSSTAQETDAAPPISETDGPPGAETNVSSSSEPPNPYKKMRVANKRSILSEGRGGWGDVVDGIALASLVG